MPSTMSFWGKKRKIPLCLLLLAQLSHAQYISCRETLTSANGDGDATLQAAEIPGFVFQLSSGIVDAASVDSLPVPLQTVFISRANSINLLGILDPTNAAAVVELDTFCDDVYNALGEHLGITITQNACIGALQTADTSPGNGRVSFEPEFLAFTASLAGTDFGVTTAAELPAGLIRVFDDFSGGTDVKSSAGLEYLVQFCQRTALQAKIELDKPDVPATTAPAPVASTSLPVPPMVAPTLSPVAASPIPQPTTPAPVAVDSESPVAVPTSTEFVLTDDFYASCLTSMQASDQNGNNLMESSEYPVFIDGILEGAYAETPFDELDPLFQTAFNENAVVRESINIFGAKPGESPDADQTSYLRQVCSAAGQADLDLAGGETTPVPAPAGSETTSPAPMAPGLVSPECQAAIEVGGSWSQDSYALFVQKLAPSLDGDYETLPYLLQDNYKWIMNGEESIMIPDTPYGEAYTRFICDRTQRLIDQPEKGQTMEEQCTIALKVASSDGSTLSQDEYVVFLNQLSGFAWEGIQFDALDLLLRDVFEENETEGKAVASSNEFCVAVSQALEATRSDNAFYQQCTISLIGANTDLDSSVSTAEYAELFSALDGGTDDAAFDDLSDNARVNYELLAEDNGIQVPGLLAPNRTQEESESLRGLCDSIEAIINVPDDSGNATRVTVFNAFVLQNDLGFTQRDMEIGVLRNTLESAYRNFVTAQVAKLVKPTGDRRKLSGSVLLDDTIRLYRFEDIQCPSGASGSCQRAYGSFDVEANQDNSILSSEYSLATQAAIDDGALQDEVTKLDPDFELVVHSSSEVLRPDEGVYPSASTGEKDNTVLVSVLTILFGALFGMLGAAAVAYYIVRNNLPPLGTETNARKTDPELALFDHFDTNDNEQPEAPTDDPYGNLAVFSKTTRSASNRDASERSQSEQSEATGFDRYALSGKENNNFNFPASQATADEQSDDEESINSDAMFQKEEITWSNNSPIRSPVDQRGREGEADPRITSPNQNQFENGIDDHSDNGGDDLEPMQYGALKQPTSPLRQQAGLQQEESDQAGSSALNASHSNSEYELQDLEDEIHDVDTMQMTSRPDNDEEYSVEVQEEEFSEEIQEEELSEEVQEEEFSEEVVEEVVSESEVDEEETDDEGATEDERGTAADDVQSGGSSQDQADMEDESEEGEDNEEEKSEPEESEEPEDDDESDGDTENDNAEAKPPYRDEIAALMQQVMPDEMENLDAMLEQFSGREDELLETLENMVNAGSDDEDDEDYSEEGEDAEQSEDDEEEDDDEDQERELGSEEEEEREDEEEEEEEEENSKAAASESEEEESDAAESEGEETASGASEEEDESESEAAASEEEESESEGAESEEEEQSEAASEEESEAEESEEEESEEASESESEEETEAPEASDSDDSDDSDSS